MTEAQLIHDCKQGKKAAQYLLVRRHAGMLLSVCRRYARDEAMAKDVLQETFLRIFTHIGKYEPTGSFEAWMRRIAVRRSLQWLEKSAFQHELQPVDLPDYQTVEHSIASQMDVEEIMQLVMELPPGFRAVFNLAVVEGYSHQEIAAMLGITENTSRSQLTRARQSLQERIHQLNNHSRYEMASVRK